MSKFKTLVTGGAGFIGSHLVKRLIDEGRDVIAVDNFERGSLQNHSDLDINIGCLDIDLTDSSLVINLFKTNKFNSVFHLAARIGNIEYLHSDSNSELSTLNTNLLIDANIIRECMKTGVETIVYASSISVYPIDLQEKIGSIFSESDLKYVNPEGGYGWAKYIGEQQLKWLNTKVRIARIFNVYGELKPIDDTAHVISRFIKGLISGVDEFHIWGTGEQTRCFLYISDCIDALLLLEKKTSNQPLIINIGSEKPTSIIDLAKTTMSVLNKIVNIKYDSTKPVGPLSRTANISKAKSHLGWDPKIGLEEGIARTAKWIKTRIKND